MRTLFIILAFSFSAILSACSKPKGNYEHALAAFEKKDYQTALTEFKPLAESGNAQAQYYMGRLYMIGGPGLPTDDVQLAKWLQKSAEQGHVEAQFMLGELYARGIGVREDQKKMTFWWIKAADKGHATALANIGDFAHHGVNNIKADLPLSYACYTLSLEKEDAAHRSSAVLGLNQIGTVMTQEQIQAGRELLQRLKAPGSSLEKELELR